VRNNQALAVLDDAGSIDVGAQHLGGRVVVRHAVLLATFLMQPDRPAPRGRRSSTFTFKAAVMRANL
jgi:hypothetical protein